MIKLRVPILVAEILDSQKITVSTDACKGIVEKFNKSGKSLPVLLQGQLPIGKVVNMEYVETDEKKVIMADIELDIVCSPMGVDLRSLQTPTGIRIIECDLKAVILSLKLPAPSEKK